VAPCCDCAVSVSVLCKYPYPQSPTEVVCRKLEGYNVGAVLQHAKTFMLKERGRDNRTITVTWHEVAII